MSEHDIFYKHMYYFLAYIKTMKDCFDMTPTYIILLLLEYFIMYFSISRYVSKHIIPVAIIVYVYILTLYSYYYSISIVQNTFDALYVFQIQIYYVILICFYINIVNVFCYRQYNYYNHVSQRNVGSYH